VARAAPAFPRARDGRTRDLSRIPRQNSGSAAVRVAPGSSRASVRVARPMHQHIRLENRPVVSIRTAPLRTVMFAWVVLSCACAGGPTDRPMRTSKVPTGAGTLAAARRYLEGQWQLQSFDLMAPDGTAVPIHGTGMLVYDAYSNLKMDIRVDEESMPVLERAGIALTDRMIAFAGYTAVDMQAHTLTYMLEGQPKNVPPTGPLAPNRPRHWDVTGDVLTLTTKDDAGKPVSISKWAKVR